MGRPGRPPIGEAAMSGAERIRRWRERHGKSSKETAEALKTRTRELEAAPIKESVKADIEEGQRLRGWIANAYAQIEFLLGDLIWRCRAFPEYQAETASRLPHKAVERVHKVRRMLQKEGCLEPFVDDLTSIIDRFKERHEIRNLLAHGFCTYLRTPSGDAAFEFQKWHRQEDRDAKMIQRFRLPDLAAEQESLVALSEEALRLFRQMHRHFGWEGPA